MSENATTVEEIQRQMSRIRAELPGEVEEVVENARQLSDWRYYVRAYPWASLAVAAAVGYFAVPRRLEIRSPDAETLTKLAKDNRLVVSHQPKGEEKSGLMLSLANFAGNMLLRAGVAYIGQKVGQVVQDPSHSQVKNHGPHHNEDGRTKTPSQRESN